MERFTISLDDALAAAFDAWLAGRGYATRSEAVRDLLRAELARAAAQAGVVDATECVASLSYVYDHHERRLAARLTALQHERHELVVAATHVHLDDVHCLETVVLRGDGAAVRRLAEAVCAERGVLHGQVNLIGVAPPGAAPHGHRHAHADAPAADGGDAAAPSGR